MRVAISFTGGKDSVLASHLVLNAGLRAAAGWEDTVIEHAPSAGLRAGAGRGDGVVEHATPGADAPETPTPTPTLLPPTAEIVVLATFAPPAEARRCGDEDTDNERGFKAHPLRLVRAQAAALAAGIAVASSAAPPPLIILDIVPPHADSYAAQIARLKQDYRIDALVSGDVLDVCSGFMARACARAGLRLVTPLWEQPRERILGALAALGIRSIVTCVDVRKFARHLGGQGEPGAAAADDDPVAMLLGRELTRELWDGPGSFLRRAGVDLCGEGGELHTAVFEAPHLFLPRLLRVEVVGHAFKGEAHAHVLLGEVGAAAAW